MKKILTLILTLVTILTAFPVTTVHATDTYDNMYNKDSTNYQITRLASLDAQPSNRFISSGKVTVKVPSGRTATSIGIMVFKENVPTDSAKFTVKGPGISLENSRIKHTCGNTIYQIPLSRTYSGGSTLEYQSYIQDNWTEYYNMVVILYGN